MENRSIEELYQEREKRVNDAIQLKVPDRVPVILNMGIFPVKHSGITAREAMYDYDKVMKAWIDTYIEFQPDMFEDGFFQCFYGEIFEIMGCKDVKWPGHGVDENSGHTYQYVERENMKAEEYDAFIHDPTDFIVRRLWPRIFGALEPLENLPPLNNIFCYLSTPAFMAFNDPGIKGAFEAIFKAAENAGIIMQGAMEQSEKLVNLGFPPANGSGSAAPFDMISDFFRGTQGSMLDMFRNPDKLLKATEKMLPIMLQAGLMAKEIGCPRVFMPLHKGLDTFMSPDQFKTFYWPTLKKLLENLISEGLNPVCFWEGDVTSRLEIIGDLPKGKAVHYFERTDIFKAKEILGDTVCIRGNVPISIMTTGNPADVKDYCKKLIDVVGKGGGFIMDCSAVLGAAKSENVKTLIDFTKEYGVYA
jgi:hypothetical protein